MSGWKKYLSTVLLLLFVGMIGFSGWKLYGIYAEYKEGTDHYDAMIAEFQAVEADGENGADADNAHTADGNGAEKSDQEPVPFDWENPPKYAPIHVDFDKLSDVCDDVVGWLYCEGTPINYPVVQSEDNDYYLYRMIDGRSNKGGSIFMDFRNQADGTDRNMILYGHNMKNDSMFGTLADYQDQEYYHKHPVMYYLTPDQDYRVELVSGYVTPADDMVTYQNPQTDEQYAAMVSRMLKKSTFDTEADISGLNECAERLITLSTCVYDYENSRYVVVGILKPLEKRTGVTAF